MAKRDRLHIVVRWGASVLVARDVPRRTRAIRAALVAAHCDELATRVAIEDGELRIDDRPLPQNGDVTQCAGDYGVEASATVGEPRLVARPKANRGAVAAIVLSTLLHAALIGVFLHFRTGLAPDDEAAAEERVLAFTTLEQNAARSAAPLNVDGPAGPAGGEAGGRSAGRSGVMGSRTAPATHKRYGMVGAEPVRSARGRDPGTDASSFGMIGLLTANFDGPHDNGWGDALNGSDPRQARGDMWGIDVGASFGIGGLGLSGIGSGAGGSAHSVGLVDGLDFFGAGAGCGCGDDMGVGHSRLAGTHRSRAPIVDRSAAAIVSGRLPPEAIQRIVRQNFGRFRLCYESALRTQPNLLGRVSVRFLIARDGSVASASLLDTSMPADASACVVRSFASLSFPEPEGGTVDVSYPLTFSPE